MLINKIENENFKKYTYSFQIGNHTTSGDIDVIIYRENYIIDLHKEIKQLLKQFNTIKVKRKYKQSEIKELNNKLTEYIQEQKEFYNKLQELSFLDKEQVTPEEMNIITSLANNYGRHGSKSYLKYKDVREIIQHFEDVIDTLKYNGDSLYSIAV
jgi:thiamine biosynthesis lipoprotein ApbE